MESSTAKHVPLQKTKLFEDGADISIPKDDFGTNLPAYNSVILKSASVS
jgi:hypothetical protein